MTAPLFSSSWYRVAELTPRLRSHAQIHRQRYRGQTWYVLQDPQTGRFHRFGAAGHLIIGLMDGHRTIQEIWDLAMERLGDDAPTQDEMIQLLSQLHAADVLQCDVPPATAELLRRRERQQRRLWQSRLFSVFAWRFPLFDPERFVRWSLPLVRPLTGWGGGILWLAVVGPAVVLAASHWADLTQDVMDRVLAPQNLLLLWLAFPLVKALHEFGHAYAVKMLGGEVHDMGVTILVLTPVPYVDASAAWAFRDRWQRIVVGAAGMVVEVFVAALALFVWLNAQPGLVRALAYDIIFIAGISTVVFNGNPLLRFDGYYILADLLEIPNLRQRSNQYLGYLSERYLFGRRDAELPTATGGELAWFFVYSIASFAYRILVAVGIILFIADKFALVGVILAVLGTLAWGVVPVVKGVSYLLTSPRLRRVRARALLVSGAIAAAVLAVIFLVPVPSRTRAEGVVWIPDESHVRAGTEGFIERVAAEPGARVRRGDVLFVSQDPVLATRVQVLQARLRELEARYTEAWAACACPVRDPDSGARSRDLVRAEMIKEEMRYVAEDLARARERAADLTVRSRADGTFVVPGTLPAAASAGAAIHAEDLPGRFARQGELLGYVVDLATIRVRAVVSQADIDLVRLRTRQVDVRLAERLAESTPAAITRIVPGATEQLPSTALGSVGGGQIPIDPRDAQGVKAMQTVFQVELELPADSRVMNVGGRVYVRFDYGWEPLATQWYRQVRQLFLARFNV